MTGVQTCALPIFKLAYRNKDRPWHFDNGLQPGQRPRRLGRRPAHAGGAKTYVLMGYKDFANSHLAAVRQDSCLDEMFVLRRDRDSAIDENVVYNY